MHITLEGFVLEKLLHHAAFAASLVGHLDDDMHRDVVGRPGGHVDAIVHGLAELRGHRRALAKQGGPDWPDDGEAYDGAPMITASAEGAR